MTTKKKTTVGKRVAIYARVSTTDKGQDPETRLRQLREYVERRGFILACELIDHASGTREDRRNYKKLFELGRRRGPRATGSTALCSGTYNEQHRHSGIQFVTPAQRHRGADPAILAKRKDLYEAAKQRNPQRWSGNTRNWEPVREVWLNPENPENADAEIRENAA